jgi:stage II sporulation protein AB (anti-sigma F factor)
MSEISDIKTAVSEAVTNAVVHAYEDEIGEIEIQCRIKGQVVEIIVEDFGCGIADVEKAREPLFTTRPELERSGMGFSVMESFMDELVVLSEKDVGTKVILRKKISEKKQKTLNEEFDDEKSEDD